jgi:response regulator RpfG family c-di-GMP phosphodiesterase
MSDLSEPLDLLVVDRYPTFSGMLREAAHYADAPTALRHEVDGHMALASAARKMPDVVMLSRDLTDPAPEQWTVAFRKLFPESRTKIFVVNVSQATTELRSPTSETQLLVVNSSGVALDCLEWVREQADPPSTGCLLSVHQALRLRDYRTPPRELRTIRNLCRLATLRDTPSASHTTRVAKYAERIAARLGMPEPATEALGLASMLHDIGHIAVPESVLRKVGPLSDEEAEVMKSHARAGQSILSAHEGITFALAAEVARSHHEQWDGHGYPDGLAGDAIPLSARIVAVADCFDRFMSGHGLDETRMDEALNFLREHSGRLFDPTLVADLAAVMPEIRQVWRQYPASSSKHPQAAVNWMPDPVTWSDLGS